MGADEHAWGQWPLYLVQPTPRAADGSRARRLLGVRQRGSAAARDRLQTPPSRHSPVFDHFRLIAPEPTRRFQVPNSPADGGHYVLPSGGIPGMLAQYQSQP
jgi:hypothetical protein